MTIREKLALMELIKRRNDAHVREWQKASAKQKKRGVHPHIPRPPTH